MKIIANILYLEKLEFIKSDKNPDGLVPAGTYKSLQQRGQIDVISKGHGSDVLIKYESLPPVYKKLVIERFGDPYEYVAKQPIRDLIVPDEKAREFFDNYNGCNLDDIDRRNYANDAALLNAFNKLLSNKRELKKMLNITIAAFWAKACEIVKEVAPQFPNTLPASERRLKPHYNSYVQSGFDYTTLIDGRKFNETNNKKVDAQLEWLIMSLFVAGRPYKNEVYDNYLKFLAGNITLVDKKKIDKETGECQPFDNNDYLKYGELSDTTIWRILSKPANMRIIDKLRLNALDYSNKHTPYNERTTAQYSLSKMTMDDLEIPFKMPNGERVKAYEVIDVASEFIIGKAFARDKTSGLLLNSLRDMFAFLANNNFGIPAEIEFEHHLTNTFSDDLLKKGNVFPFTRLCRAANPREKRAEHMFRRKRYSKEIKNVKGFQGRPFARDEANRANDRNNTTYTFEQIVAIEEHAIAEWNNDLHPKQDKYPGMTRWEVFMANINPSLAKINHKTLARYIGQHTATTIRNNKLMTVQHNTYWLPNPQSIELFDNYSVTAYYIPDADGSIPEIHVYQNDEYKCTCTRSQPYNEAQAEQTDEDVRKMHVQFGYRRGFDAIVKEGVAALAKVEIIENEAVHRAIAKPAKSIKPKDERPMTYDLPPTRQKIDYSKMAEDDL